MVWGLKVLFGALWRDLGRALGAYKQGTLIFASETKARTTKQHKGRACEEGARRVQGGGEYGSKGKWKSASAPRDHQEEEIKDDLNLSDTL